MKLPFGKSKGLEIAEAPTDDLEWLRDRVAAKLVEEPDSRFAASNRALVAEIDAELAGRSGGAPAAQAAQKPPAAKPSQAIQRAQTTSLGKSIHDPAAVTAHLQELASNYHIVTPATRVDAIPAGCGVAISYVTVDPNPRKDGPGEVFEVGGKLGLSGTTLAKIGAAAGVDWDPSQTGRLDDGRDPNYVHYRAVGYVRNFDGSVRTLTGEVEMDAREGSPQIEEIKTKAANAKNWKTKKPEPRDPRPQILELRKFLIRHAERKAKNRAIADMGVKRSYNPSELTKPFAVARLMWTGETSDPELRRVFAEKTADAMIGGMSQLYGRQSGAPSMQRPVALPAPASAPTPKQFTGHVAPPVGTVDDDPEDLDTYDYDVAGEEKPPSNPQAAAENY